MDRTTEDRARDGSAMLRDKIPLVWEQPLRELAAKADCGYDEVEACINRGAGPVGGLPEPRVIWALSRALEVDYIDAMIAFGHRKPRTPPAS